MVTRCAPLCGFPRRSKVRPEESGGFELPEAPLHRIIAYLCSPEERWEAQDEEDSEEEDEDVHLPYHA